MRRIIPVISGYTKVQVLSFIKMKLKINSEWAKRACLVIFDQQTQDEKKKHLSISGHNGCGFSRNDAPLLSAIACRLRQHRITLEDLRMLGIYMEKYAAQLVCIADQHDGCSRLKVHLDKYYKPEKQALMPF